MRPAILQLSTMGSQVSKQIERRKAIAAEKKILADLLSNSGDLFPGSDYRPSNRSNWISQLGDLQKLHLYQIVWPGTHDSATDCIGFPFISRPFAQCQSLCIYDQLTLGARLIDIRVQQDRRVCHGVLKTYPIDHALDQIIRFISDSPSEIVILEIRTEFGYEDPPGFDSFLIDRLGDHLIHHDDSLFSRTVAEILPKQIILIWKPRKAPPPHPGGAVWSAGYLRDNWIDTDLPNTKFESNMKHLGQQPAVVGRKYFYRVENTVTPQADNPVVCVRPVTGRIQPYARLFISQAFARGFGDRLQVFSTDFIDEDFVDACAALTLARLEGKA
ncbi:uncharacterized protein LOC110025292 isoform X3 [Phalaenopsis equestris]|uniref:uncharacterized protein LOC110025292 isoform X2 n=1 Tax=Phalaenopsis equestris TaxID=78828 RepID=UPI0009E1DE14|nr:uncharacterized protein LOC110025292 isoform X2 [Phalaenopsis equestris]XP_020581362.1 uncharacterized protein LOC110025292 isoform X3 [Phalaenopsis equestris]